VLTRVPGAAQAASSAEAIATSAPRTNDLSFFMSTVLSPKTEICAGAASAKSRSRAGTVKDSVNRSIGAIGETLN